MDTNSFYGNGLATSLQKTPRIRIRHDIAREINRTFLLFFAKGRGKLSRYRSYWIVFNLDMI